MTHLLDTNVCIGLINGRPAVIRERLRQAIDVGSTVTVSSIAWFELWYGVAKSARYEKNADRLDAFLAGPLRVLAFDVDDARIAGNIRMALEAKGTPIGAYDVLIAAQAIRTEATLVTANSNEFARVRGLVWEDWVSGASSARS